MRRFLILLVILVVLAGAVVGAGLYLLNHETFLKSRINALAIDRIGRELRVEGPLRIEPGRQVVIDASDIRLQNAAWAGPAEMLRLGRLRVVLDLPSLLRGQPIIHSLELADCRIDLVRNASGEANWELETATADKEPPPAREEPPLFLQNSRIERCRLSHSSPEREAPLVLEVDSLVQRLEPDRRLHLAGEGRVRGESWSLAGWMAPARALLSGGAVEHELRFALGDIELESSGRVEDLHSGSGINVATRFSGPDIGRVLEDFLLPPLSEGPFDFRARLDTAEDHVGIDVDGDLGTLVLTAAGTLDRLHEPRTGAMRFDASGPNLGALAAALGLAGLVPEPFKLSGELALDNQAVELQTLTLETTGDRLEVGGRIGAPPVYADTALDLSLGSADLSRWAGRWGLPDTLDGPLSLTGRLQSDSSGSFAVDASAGLLDSDARIEATLGRLAGPFPPDTGTARFGASGPNLGKLAATLGLAGLVPERFSLQGALSFDQRSVELETLLLETAGDRIELGGTFGAAPAYADTALEVALESTDLARWAGRLGLPDVMDGPLVVTGRLDSDANGLFGVDGTIRFADNDARLKGALGPLANRFEPRLEIQLASPDARDLGARLGIAELPAAPLQLDGQVSWTAQELGFDPLRLDLGGHRAVYSGSVVLGGTYPKGTVTVTLDSPDLAALGGLFGTDGLPAEPLKLGANLELDGKGVAFRTQSGTLGQLRLELDGRIPDLDRPQLLGGEFDVRLPSLQALRALAPGAELPDLAVSARGRLDNSPDLTRLQDVALALGDMEGRLSGTVTAGGFADLSLAIAGPDASMLGPWSGDLLEAKPFAAESRLAGSVQGFDLTGLNVRVGDSRASGQLRIDLDEAVAVTGSIRAEYLDLAYLAKRAEEEPSPQPADPQRRWLFDETPIASVNAEAVRLELDLESDLVALAATRVRDLRLGIHLTPRRLAVQPLSLVEESGGSLDGALVLDSTGETPRLEHRLHARNLRLGLLAAEGQDIASYPPVDIDVNLTGRGATRRAMASSIDGTVRFYFGAGDVAPQGLRFLYSDFLTEFISLLNPFSGRSDFTHLDCGVLAADAVAGQVTLSPLLAQTREVTTVAGGTIDLHTERLNLSFNTKVRQGLGLSAGALINPLIKVGGTLAKPAIELDPTAATVHGGVAVATLGLSVVAKSLSDRFLSSKDPCGDALREIEQRDREAGAVR